jgi:hypothetical protein
MGILNRIKGLAVPPKLVELVQDQLEQRILQELEILSERLSTTTTPCENAIFRTLKGSELEAMKAGTYQGNIQGLSAILDLSGLSKSQKNKDQILQFPLLEVKSVEGDSTSVPLYNVASMLNPQHHTRTAKLVRELSVNNNTSPSMTVKSLPILGVFIPPTEEGILHIPLLIALWRLRCWYGHGWEETQVDGKGWPYQPPSEDLGFINRIDKLDT